MYGLLCDFQTILQALSSDVGEMSNNLVSWFVADIPEDIHLSMLL
jgi:hypothetical protein